MAESTSDYTATVWGETHRYSVVGERLLYVFDGSNAEFSIDLGAGGFFLLPRSQTHRYFRVGLILIAFPLFTLSVIYAKQHNVSGLGAMLYVHLTMLALGLALVVRFRSIYRAHLLRTAGGDELLIYRDPANADRADAFISQINALA